MSTRKIHFLWLACVAFLSVPCLAEPELTKPFEDPAFSFNAKFQEPETKIFHKMLLRGSGGMISNVGTASGSTITYGGVGIGAAFYFMEQIALGFAYRVESTFATIPLRGFDVFFRYYYLGSGTVVEHHDSTLNKIVTQRTWSPYLGTEFSNRAFNFVIDAEANTPEERSISGNISALNFVTGLDYRLSRRWDLNLELSYTLLALGGSDPRIKIKWMLFSYGANYVF